MHPILGQFRRLILYLTAWIPLSVLLAYLLAVIGNLRWVEAAVVALPLCAVYAFVCLSAWYSCRMMPIDRASFSRLLVTHLTGAVVGGAFWVLAARVLASALSSLPAFAHLSERLAKAYPILFGAGVFLDLLAVALFYVLLAVEASHEAQEREMRAGVLARDAELKALKAQVNPHFLFNSLHSISALTSSDSAKAREMCILLAEFLRKTLGLGEKTVITFNEEMALVRSFLAVEKVRFGSRIDMDENIESETLELLMPPLLLQPLVENAIAHGIANLPVGGWIRLAARREADKLYISIENSFDPEAPSLRKNGMGLANVRQRLNARYGRHSSFLVKTDGDCFRVNLILPAEGNETRP